jgi:YbbR domain-containing protein
MNHQNCRAFFYSLKRLAVLLLLLLSSFEPVQSAAVNETETLIPIDPYKLPEGLTLVGPPLKEIEVRVQGTPSDLEYLLLNKPRYRLDLSGAAVGVESIPIDPDLIKMPEGVKITRVNPAYLTVKVDRWKQKQVPVKVSVSGNPPGSYFINGTLAEPSSVLICGPETIVDLVDEIRTKAIDVNGRSETFKKEIALELAAGVKVCSSSGIILAEIFFAEKDVTRRFTNVPVEGRNTPFVFNISPPGITIEIKGPQNIVENLHPEKDIQVRMELKNLNPGVYVRRATITLPVKTTLLNVEPELFTVKIIGGAQGEEK